MNNYKVMDNFLPEDVFKNLSDLILTPGTFPFFYSNEIADGDDPGIYFIHNLFADCFPTSPYYEAVMNPLIEHMGINTLHRSKVNAYLRTEKIVEHGRHVDVEGIPMNVAVFYVNSNDGFTRIDENNVVASVANRLLLLDGSVVHNSTTCTDQDLRVSININFL